MRYSKTFKITTSVLALQLALPAIAPSSLSASSLVEFIKSVKGFQQVEAEHIAQAPAGYIPPKVLEERVDNIQTARTLAPNGGVEFVEQYNYHPDWATPQLMENVEFKSDAQYRLRELGRNSRNMPLIDATVRCIVAGLNRPSIEEIAGSQAYINVGHNQPTQDEIEGYALNEHTRPARIRLAELKLDAGDDDLVTATAAILRHMPDVPAEVILEVGSERDPERYPARIHLATINQDPCDEDKINAVVAFHRIRIGGAPLSPTAIEVDLYVRLVDARKAVFLNAVHALRVEGQSDVTLEEARAWHTSTPVDRPLTIQKIKAKRAFSAAHVDITRLANDVAINAWIAADATIARKNAIVSAVKALMEDEEIVDPTLLEIDVFAAAPLTRTGRKTAVERIAMERDFPGVRDITANEATAWRIAHDDHPTRQLVGQAALAFRASRVPNVSGEEINIWVEADPAHRDTIVRAVAAFKPSVASVTNQEMIVWSDGATPGDKTEIIQAVASLRTVGVIRSTPAQIAEWRTSTNRPKTLQEIRAKNALTTPTVGIAAPTPVEINFWVDTDEASKALATATVKALREATLGGDTTRQELIEFIMAPEANRGTVVDVIRTLRGVFRDSTTREEIQALVAAGTVPGAREAAIVKMQAKRAFHRDVTPEEINLWNRTAPDQKAAVITCSNDFRTAGITNATTEEMLAWLNIHPDHVARRPEIIQAVLALRAGKPLGGLRILGAMGVKTPILNLAISEIYTWVFADPAHRTDVIEAVDAFRKAPYLMQNVSFGEIDLWMKTPTEAIKLEVVRNAKALRDGGFQNLTSAEISAHYQHAGPKAQVLEAIRILREIDNILNAEDFEILELAAAGTDADKLDVVNRLRGVRRLAPRA